MPHIWGVCSLVEVRKVSENWVMLELGHEGWVRSLSDSGQCADIPGHGLTFFSPSFIHSLIILQIMLVCRPNWIQTITASPLLLENVSRAPTICQALTQWLEIWQDCLCLPDTYTQIRCRKVNIGYNSKGKAKRKVPTGDRVSVQAILVGVVSEQTPA